MSFPTTLLTTLAPPNPSAVSALTFSHPPSASYLLTATTSRAIHLWNPSTSRLIQTFTAHAHAISDLALTRDNATFASVGGDKAVFIWDVATAKVTRKFHGHVGRIEAVTFGGEGGTMGSGESVVVSGGLDGTVRIWDLRAKGEGVVGVMDEAKDSVTCVEVGPGVIWSGSLDGRVRFYDLAAGHVDVDAVGAGVTGLTPTIKDGGQGYLVSTVDGKVRLMDRRDGKCLQEFEVPGASAGGEGEYRIRSTLAVGDGVAISGTADGRVVAWDVATGKVKSKVWHTEGGASSGKTSGKDVVSVVAWNETRKIWASGGGDGRVTIWGERR